MSAAPTELQLRIKESLRKNRNRKRKGFKSKGVEWVKTQQMMCMVAGHHISRPSRSDPLGQRLLVPLGVCVYCGAKA